MMLVSFLNLAQTDLLPNYLLVHGASRRLLQTNRHFMGDVMNIMQIAFAFVDVWLYLF